MKQKAVHHPHNHKICNNHLILNGRDITEVAQSFNSAFYAYDSKLLTERVKQLKSDFSSRVHFHYAMKANPMPELVRHMASITDGFDVASGGELKVALATGMDSSNISFAGPGKSVDELSLAVTSGTTLNIESTNELQRIVNIGENTGVKPKVAIRVNPDFELKASGMKMAGGSKPFGIDAELVPDIIKSIHDMDIHFRGFHIFSGSQNLQADSLIEAQTATLNLADELSQCHSDRIELLNIGGGFGIPYFPGDKPLDLTTISDNFETQLDLHQSAFSDTEIVIELGRYLVGEAGIYVCQVTDKKVSRGKTYLICNGGLHHHLAASGNFGQLIRKNYPVVIASNMASEDMEVVSIVGPLCTPLDILADNMELPKAEIGDYIAVLQSGAYGFTASPHLFLSQPLPSEILL